MALVVRNIPLGLDEPEDLLLQRAADRLHVPVRAIRQYAVVRRSLDARKGRDIHYVFSVELTLDGGLKAEKRCLQRLHGRNVALVEPAPPEPIEPGNEPLPHRPIIIGLGPAGMFAALRLVEFGYRPLILERGRDVRRRHRDILHDFYRERQFHPESNLLFGEGGAGTYSDGKVYTRVSDPAVREILAVFCRFGADGDVLLDAKPHIGSDRLPTICRRIREHLIEHGAEVRFDACVTDLEVQDGKLVALQLGEERVPAGPVLLGIGHSARDTYLALHRRGVRLDAKPFQLGVRIEHPQAMVNAWQYGPAATHPRVPPADYQLVAKGAAGVGDLFSFCMCPGGTILPTNEAPGLIATNGASRSSRGGPFANSGFVITIDPAEVGHDPLAGIALQRRCEEQAFAATCGTYAVPAQRCSDFLAGRRSDGPIETSYPLGSQPCEIAALLPPAVVAALRRGLPALAAKLPGFAGPEGVITAPETRASAPVRITRDPVTRESVSTANLYPIGEGAGYAGGIVSAALDGRRSADALIRRYPPTF
jgi:uncharacterized FAD-dependent dehydrogenase